MRTSTTYLESLLDHALTEEFMARKLAPVDGLAAAVAQRVITMKSQRALPKVTPVAIEKRQLTAPKEKA